MKQYDTFILLRDLNPVIKKGFRGVILDTYEEHIDGLKCVREVEVEFVKENGTNYAYNNEATFCIDVVLIKIICDHRIHDLPERIHTGCVHSHE